MSRTPEAIEKDAVKAHLTALGAYHHWPVPGGYGRQGIDCYACIQGKFFAFEVKAPGEEPTKRQEQTMGQIREAGGITIWGTAEQIIECLKHAILP